MDHEPRVAGRAERATGSRGDALARAVGHRLRIRPDAQPQDRLRRGAARESGEEHRGGRERPQRHVPASSDHSLSIANGTMKASAGNDSRTISRSAPVASGLPGGM